MRKIQMKLLTVTTAALLLFTHTGQADTAPIDSRQVVELNKEQQAFVLGHMKSMLETISTIQSDLAQGQAEHVAQRVQALKTNEHQNKPRGLGKSFPKGFRAMSRQMNQHWKVLLEPTTDDKKIQQELHLILNQCNACHRSYQLKR